MLGLPLLLLKIKVIAIDGASGRDMNRESIRVSREYLIFVPSKMEKV